MLELSGELADGVITHGITDALTKYCLDKVAVGAKRTGRNAKAVDYVSFTTILPSKTPDLMKDLLKPRNFSLVGGEYSEELIPLYGLSIEEVAPLRTSVKRGDFKKAGSLMTNKMMDAFLIVGSTDQCLEQVAKMVKMGVTHFITNIPQVKGVDGKQFLEDVSRIAAHFRS